MNQIEEDKTMNELGNFLEELKDADPNMSNILDDILENYGTLLNREVRNDICLEAFKCVIRWELYNRKPVSVKN
tara:strand:- start:45 stop:266 length:222 start_codon:yes stop_codon:yes gene_type:complete